MIGIERLIADQWQVQDGEILKSALGHDPEVTKALLTSSKMKTWRAIKS